MIRSVLTLLAALAFMAVSLTASAHAMRMDDGPGHSAQMQATSVSAQCDDAMAMVLSCGGMGDLSCAFACAGIATPAAPARLHGPCHYGSTHFFVARPVPPTGRSPEQAERPPRF